MRITTHGNDLLVTDQALGLGAFLLTLGVFLLVAALERAIGGALLTLPTITYALAGAFGVRGGLARLVASQLIVDTDRQLLIARRWGFSGTDVQRIPFDAVQGFTISPPDRDKGTELVIETSRGPVHASAGMKGPRAAWLDVIAAVEAHMGRA